MSASLVPQIGAIAGWKLSLSVVTPTPIPQETTTFSSVDYRGSVDVTLVSGLAPGSFTIVVEGVSEADFRALTKRAQGPDPLEARLFLFWVDAPPAGLGRDGLVAVLRVTALRRRTGTWRYEVVVEGREWVYDRVMAPCPVVTGHGPIETAAAIANALNVKLDPPPPPATSTDVYTTHARALALDELRALERAMVQQAAAEKKPRAGLGMYLIRDGKLQLGPNRIVAPVAKSLRDARDGLLAVERSGRLREDEQGVSIDDTTPADRDQFVLTLRGRPDLKPGDVISFAAPEAGSLGEDLGFALGPAPAVAPGAEVLSYVQEVTHRLNREQGFVTVVRAVSAKASGGDLVDRLWFAGATADSAAAAGSGESLLARTFERVRDAARPERWSEVAQVRAHHLGNTEAPAQTETLWRGLAPNDGAPNGATRLAFGSQRKALPSVPYVTPFAYGKCGLIVPRYPGTRVLVTNRGGDPADPLDVGALWARGQSPDTAKMGDWWLSLPVDLDGAQPPRASVPDDQSAEQQSPAKVTHDLTDAAGNRVIEVGKLTIRIGKERLTGAGVRPVVADAPVTIEHDSGKARIVISQDGSIVIESVKTLTLKGDDGITLQSKKDVTVMVGQHLTVKKGA